MTQARQAGVRSLGARLLDGVNVAVGRLMARLWLRACDTVGPGTRTFFRPRVANEGEIRIGRGVRINSNWAPTELVTGPRGVIEIGDEVYINYGTLVSARSRVRIGRNVMVGNYCIIADTDAPGMDEGNDVPDADAGARPVTIGDRAWLAARVTVLPGATIGPGAVIAAGSVVAGHIPDGALAGGIPARVLRPGRSGGDGADGETP